jgi:hypothetical protein
MDQPPSFYFDTCPIAVSIPPTLSIVLPARRTIRLVFAGRELYAASAMPVAQNAVPTPAAVKKVFAALFIFISSVIICQNYLSHRKRYYSMKIIKAKDR